MSSNSSNTRILTKNDRISFSQQGTPVTEKLLISADFPGISTLYVTKATGVTSNTTTGVLTSINPGAAPLQIDTGNMMVGIGGINHPQYTLDVSGGLRVPNLYISTLFGGLIQGDGAGLYNIPGSALQPGAVPPPLIAFSTSSQLLSIGISTLSLAGVAIPTEALFGYLSTSLFGSNTVPLYALKSTGSITATTITAQTFIGDGSQLTGVAANISAPLSTIALFTSNTSNYFDNTLRYDVSTKIIQTSNLILATSNFYEPLLRTAVSSGLSTVAQYTSNTSNFYLSLTGVNVSAQISSVARFTSNTSNFFSAAIISTTGGLGRSGYVSTQTLQAQLSSFSSALWNTTSILAGSTNNFSVGQLFAANLIGQTALTSSFSASTANISSIFSFWISTTQLLSQQATLSSANTNSIQASTLTFIDTETASSQSLFLSSSQLYFGSTSFVYDIPSTVAGLGTAGYVSTTQLASTITSLSNYFSTPISLNISSGFSTIALYTSNTSNYFLQNAGGAGTSSLYGITSSGLSSVALFTSNTSNFFLQNAAGGGLSSLYGEVSTGLSTTALFTSNTSNYFKYIIDNLPGLGSNIAGGSLDIAGLARAITFSSMILQTSTLYAMRGTIDTLTSSNIQAVSQQLSNLTISQPTSSEWIAFASTSNAESVLVRSSNTTSWTTSVSPFVGGQFNSLVFNGSYWLAVGTDQNNQYTSAKSFDGLTWSRYPGPFQTGLATSIAYSQPQARWVAMGLDMNSVSTLATSTDGENWSIALGPFSGGRGLAVAYNGTIWLASGNTPSNANTIATSTDGLIWTAAPGPSFANPSGYAGLAWSGTRWVLTGSDQGFTRSIAYSSDGSAWTSIPGPFAGGYGTAALYAGGQFLVTGTDATGTNTIATSSDGISWTAVTGPFTGGGYGLSLAYNGTYYLAAGYGPTNNTVLAYSANGASWTSLGNTIQGRQLLFATAASWAYYPRQTSLYVNSFAVISSLAVTGSISSASISISSFQGNLNDAMTVIVVDV